MLKLIRFLYKIKWTIVQRIPNYISVFRTYYIDSQINESDKILLPPYITIINTRSDSYPNFKLNIYWSEYSFMKYIWSYYSNRTIHPYLIGFDQYKRCLPLDMCMLKGKAPMYWSVIYLDGISVYEQYCIYHMKNDMDNLLYELERKYGKQNKYSEYIKNGNILYCCSCFLFNWSLFDTMCKFVFGILDSLDNTLQLGFIPENYDDYYRTAVKHQTIWGPEANSTFEYQRRAFGYLAERLVSAFIATHYKEDEIYLIS